MNTAGAVVISDMAQGRIWKAEPDLPLTRYSDGHGGTYLAPDQDAVFEDMRSTVDPIRRRTPAERLEATMRPLVAQALAAYKATGKIVWPRSAEIALAEIARLNHDPSLTNDTGGAEQVIKQGQALARYVADTGWQRQRENDMHKVTLDWAGH